jgi:glycosyltransferase involved in cell wall biosynthesis
MPVHNCEAFLSDQLDSLLNQTFENFEIIVINDGSSDNTTSIVKNYTALDPRIKLVDNEFAKGIAGALNTGLKYAVGKYIARADGDDIHVPDRLKTQYEYLEKFPEIGIVGANAMIFNSAGSIRETKYPSSPIELCWRFISNTYFCHPSVMFRSSIYKEIGGYPTVVVEDFAFFSLMIKRFRATNLHGRLLSYRVHEKNYSSSNIDAIERFVETKFKENYQYYVHDLRLINEFRLHQVHKQVAPRNFFKILSLNAFIINKIRLDYNMPLYSYDFLSNSGKQAFWLVESTYNYLRKNFATHVRSRFSKSNF